MTKLRLGISHCLLGENVRYDGQHRRDPFLVETLGQFVEYVPVCPEVECGLSVPREAMRLVGTVEAPRLLTQRTEVDQTERMTTWAAPRLEALAGEDLCGFIFKAKSPSSGMERVKVYRADGQVIGYGAGLFARAFMARFPLLPVEEDGRLHDPLLRENFIERIFTLRRYRDVLREGGSVASLMRFHAANKYLIASHSDSACRTLGRLLAETPAGGEAQVAAEYESGLLTALRRLATVRRHCNVLQHIMGYFKKLLSADEKQELLETIEHYREGLVPLVVPVTLLRHYARKYQVDYLLQQTYLQPHPLELKLRNHA